MLLVMQVMGLGVFFERKVSALIQDRIGANRAAILGFAGLGLVNTLIADPVKFLLKEDIVPAGTDRVLHFLAPVLSLVPVLVTFAVVPFGDVLQVGGRTINLQAAELNVGVLYVLAMVSLAVYGVVLGGWASNNRWSLLGGIRGSAQMISYEIAMGLALVSVVLTYNTLDLQEMARAQGHLLWGWLPAWGILYQPVAFLIFMTAGVAESKRIPFDLPWGAALALPSWAVALLQVTAFALKLVFCTWLQIVVRWTLPRFRYDQLMRLGWQGLLPVGLVNVVVSALVIVLAAGPAA